MMIRPAALLRVTLAVLLPALPAFAQSSPEAEMRFSTGVMHLREGRVELALEEFKKAVKEDGKNPYFQKGLGLAYSAKREWKPAIAAFRRALELNPYYVDVRNDLAAALLGSGDREAGKKEFLAAFSDPTNPTSEVSARNLGQAFYEEKNYTEALNWYRTSVGRNKDYADGYLGLADTLAATGRHEEAVVQLQAAVSEIPTDTALQLALGQALLRAGRYGEARSRLEEVVRKDPAGPLGRAAAEQLKSDPLPYRRILESLLDRVAGARTALLLDAQGEVVVGAGNLDERERLIGAYQGIALGMVSRAAQRVGGGEVKALVSRHSGGSVVLATLRDGYYLVVSLGPEALTAVAARHCEDARLRLNQEI
jgi:Flp pilus assembly protein TadD/predicted regulator of Ras-like GTPase activity (Roadblock/LC7/MglB family)